MIFEKWYEENKEALTTQSLVSKLESAFWAGVDITTDFYTQEEALTNRADLLSSTGTGET